MSATAVATAEPPEPEAEPVPFSDGVEDPARRRSRLRLATMMLVMGTLHFVIPAQFDKIIPKWVPFGSPRFWTLSSGAAELTSGALMLSPRTSRAGGAAAFATIATVYPANVQMAIDAGAPKNPAAIAAWLRLPLQFPMLATALKVARGR